MEEVAKYIESLTEEGKAAFATLLNTWNEMAGSVQALIQKNDTITSSEPNQVP